MHGEMLGGVVRYYLQQCANQTLIWTLRAVLGEWRLAWLAECTPPGNVNLLVVEPQHA